VLHVAIALHHPPHRYPFPDIDSGITSSGQNGMC
jgi:hypothetical protein